MGIGFAPFDALHHHGCKDASLLTDAGLLMNNRFLFANRIIIPIRDEQGRVIGFAGRRLPQDDKGGKYINPPATPLYEKNKVLFGLDRARRALRAGQPLILVEGPLDAIALEQSGVEGAVASSGTAFTEEQAALMARRSREISPLLLFDGDRAGQEAAQKAAELLLRHGLNPRALTLASGDDPDSWVRRIGEEEAKDQLAAASPFLDTVIERLQSMPVGTIDQDAEREPLAARWLGAIPAGTLANAFGQAASQVLGRQVVAAAPRRRQRAPAPEVADDAPAEPEDERDASGPPRCPRGDAAAGATGCGGRGGVEHLAVRRDAPVRAGPEPVGADAAHAPGPRAAQRLERGVSPGGAASDRADDASPGGSGLRLPSRPDHAVAACAQPVQADRRRRRRCRGADRRGHAALNHAPREVMP